MSILAKYSKLYSIVIISLCSLLSLISTSSFSQSDSINNTIYLDNHGKECTKKKHKYIEIHKETRFVVNGKSLFFFQIFDKKDIIQASGFYTDSIEAKQWVGLLSFYSKKGKLKKQIQYDYHSTIAFFPEMKEYSKLLKKCDTSYKILHVSFLKKGHIKKIGYYSEDKKRICTWIRYNQFDPDIVSIYEYSDSLETKRTYYSNNNLWKTSSYLNGKRHGTWKKYSKSDGWLVKEKTYENGKLIRKVKDPLSK